MKILRKKCHNFFTPFIKQLQIADPIFIHIFSKQVQLYYDMFSFTIEITQEKLLRLVIYGVDPKHKVFWLKL
jgi:hypothetical protein